MAAKKELEPLNLGTQKGIAFGQRLETSVYETDDYRLNEQYWDKADWKEFIKSGSTPLNRSGQPLVTHDGELWAVDKNGVVYYTGTGSYHQVNNANKKNQSNVSLLLLPARNKKQAFFPVLSGDDEFRGGDFVGEIANSGLESITLSFECLRRFYGEDTDTVAVAKKLAEGQITIVDYTPDSRIALNSEEKKAYKAWYKKTRSFRRGEGKNPGPCPVNPPEQGYTVVNDGEEWHRSATVLLNDVEGEFSVLIGQDEGTYFGVELADNPKTIAAAYKSLIPKEIRNETNLQRQGEWFAVAVAAPPEIPDCIFEGDGESAFWLNRDSDQSARHYVNSNDVRVGKDGKVYALDATLSHENGDHTDLQLRGWVTFYRNTAKRAFSVQGVD